MLQKAYGQTTLLKTRAYEWYSAFKSGRDMVEDLPRSVLLSTPSTEVNIAKVKEMVTENRHLSLREIAVKLSVSYESIRTILKIVSWIFHNDNVPYDKAIIVNEFLAKISTNIITTSKHPFSVDRKHKREFEVKTDVDFGKFV